MVETTKHYHIGNPRANQLCFPRKSRSATARPIRAIRLLPNLKARRVGPGGRGLLQLQRQSGHSITIRTALLKDGKAYVQAGGGWVNDSEPEAEFQETVNKSKAMLKAVALAETFAKNS